MAKLEEYENGKMRNEVTHFVSQVADLSVKNIYFLKSIDEKLNSSVLDKIKRILDSKWRFRLAFLKSDVPYDFSKLDSEGIVVVAECYYEIYIVLDEAQNCYCVVIQKHNFFPDGNNVTLGYFRKVDNFASILFRLFSKKIN